MVSELVNRAWAVGYSSATWAKSSENLHIYSRAFSETINVASLAQTMRTGGEAFSEVPYFWTDQPGVKVQLLGWPSLGDRQGWVEGEDIDPGTVYGWWKGDTLVAVDGQGTRLGRGKQPRVLLVQIGLLIEGIVQLPRGSLQRPRLLLQLVNQTARQPDDLRGAPAGRLLPPAAALAHPAAVAAGVALALRVHAEGPVREELRARLARVARVLVVAEAAPRIAQEQLRELIVARFLRSGRLRRSRVAAGIRLHVDADGVGKLATRDIQGDTHLSKLVADHDGSLF